MSKPTSKQWSAADIPSQAGKRVLITGANSGIGYHAALKLARKGAHVIFACRDRQRGESALARLTENIPGAEVELATPRSRLSRLGPRVCRKPTGTAPPPAPAHQQCRSHGPTPPPRNRRRLRASIWHQRSRPLRPHRSVDASAPASRSRIPREATHRHHRLHRAQARPPQLRRPAIHQGLRAHEDLPAIQAGQSHARLRTRSPPACRSLTDHERSRPPRRGPHQPLPQG